MIRVTCLGHVGTSVGKKELELQGDGLEAGEIVDMLRDATGLKDPGFTRFNVLIMVEDGEAFVPAGGVSRIRDGARVVVIPFSHGG